MWKSINGGLISMPNDYWLADANIYSLEYEWILHGKIIDWRLELDFGRCYKWFKVSQPNLTSVNKNKNSQSSKSQSKFTPKMQWRVQVFLRLLLQDPVSFSQLLAALQKLPLWLQVRLEWPTDLAINPMDNSIYVLDNNVVLQITENRQVTSPRC